MKNKNLLTITIGIPAYNEEKNIGNLISSIFLQTHKYFKLSNIIIVSDGSTDKTVDIIKKHKKQFPKIKIIERKHRYGKADALNLIYRLSNSDFLLTMDADLVFIEEFNLDRMVKEMIDNPSLNMVGPLHVPTSSRTFFGNLSRYSYLAIQDAALKIDEGNNFYGCMSSEFMRKKFYKSFTFPRNTISDQCYAYAMAIKDGKKGFKMVQEAKVIFGVAQTFYDWRVLSARSVVGDKADLVKHFGKGVLKDYTMPKKLYVFSLLKYFFRNPVYTLGSVLMNIYIRKFPYKKRAPKNGIWEMVSTSKELHKLYA